MAKALEYTFFIPCGLQKLGVGAESHTRSEFLDHFSTIHRLIL